LFNLFATFERRRPQTTGVLCSNSSYCVFKDDAVNNVSRLTICEREKLIDISCDSSLKDMFHVDELPLFWLLVRNDYESLSEKAIKVVFPFMT
jgi:hypothetical protein